MEIEKEEQGRRVAVLRLDGRLDLVQAPRLRDAVRETVDDGRPDVVVELSGVNFIDSSGLGMLIAGLKHARQAGGELRIAGAGPQVLLVLELTKLGRVLRPYDSLEEALAGL